MEILKLNSLLHKDGKTYLFSKMGESIVSNQLEKGQSPTVMRFLEIFPKKEDIYVTPQALRDIAPLMSGHCRLFEYEEPSYDGYVTASTGSHFSHSTQNKATQKIGEQLSVNTIRIKNENGEEKTISWSLNTRNGGLEAIENCTKRSFSVQSNPRPGGNRRFFPKLCGGWTG